MTDIGIHKLQPSHGRHQDTPSAKKTNMQDADAFTNAVKGEKTRETAGAEGEEKTTAELLKEARRNLIITTGRNLQQTAKDIERENIDKGF